MDVPDPEPILPWSGGKQEQGGYKDGEKHGQWTEWYENGQKKVIKNYIDYIDVSEKKSLLHGKWIEYYENGQIRKEANYEVGRRHGKWIEYSEDGQIITDINYNFGLY